MATNGIVLLTPSSVNVTGSGSQTATINTGGSVTFSACATLSLNGVFSSTYDNYVISVRSIRDASANINFELRLRANGSDASGANYTHQVIVAEGGSVIAARATSQTKGRFGDLTSSTLFHGHQIFFYGPALAQPTAFRGVSAGTNSSASIYEGAVTHSFTDTFDGFTLLPGSGNITGLIKVYGLVQ
jgi:hypothetical protein